MPAPRPDHSSPSAVPPRGERQASLDRERLTGVAPPQRKREQLTPRQRTARRVVSVVTLIVLVGSGVLFGLVPFASSVHDSTHRTTLTCDVQSARGSERSGHRPRRGASSWDRAVVVETRDCGQLVLRGVDPDDYLDVAADIDARPGEYRIEVGESDWALRGLWRFFRSSPGIAAYERVE